MILMTLSEDVPAGERAGPSMYFGEGKVLGRDCILVHILQDSSSVKGG